MAISQAMNTKLNEQITHEFFASQLYLSMACMFESMNLKMLAKVFRKQTEEERTHALKILDYVHDAEGRVTLQAVPQPAHEWPTVLAAVEATVEHERKVTKLIHDLVALAEQEKDYATRSFLQWFVDEQVEEIQSTTYLRDLARMAGDRLLHLEAAVAHLAKD